MQDEEVKGRMKAKSNRKATQEEMDMISQGIRPQWMERKQFVQLRAAVKIMEKEYLKGKYLHVSVKYITSVDELTGMKTESKEVYPIYRRNSVKLLGKRGVAQRM